MWRDQITRHVPTATIVAIAFPLNNKPGHTYLIVPYLSKAKKLNSSVVI